MEAAEQLAAPSSLETGGRLDVIIMTLRRPLTSPLALCTTIRLPQQPVSIEGDSSANTGRMCLFCEQKKLLGNAHYTAMQNVSPKLQKTQQRGQHGSLPGSFLLSYWVFDFTFSLFFRFWAVRWIKLAIPSAFERTLIYCIVS